MPRDVVMDRHQAVEMRERLATMEHLARTATALKERAAGGPEIEQLTDALETAALNSIRVMANDGYTIMDNLAPSMEDEG